MDALKHDHRAKLLAGYQHLKIADVAAIAKDCDRKVARYRRQINVHPAWERKRLASKYRKAVEQAWNAEFWAGILEQMEALRDEEVVERPLISDLSQGVIDACLQQADRRCEPLVKD